MDRLGTMHEIPLLGNGNCNDVLNREISIDTGSITNKQILPIKKVLYGPMPYEHQYLKITVGPVKCTPSSESNHDNNFKFDGELNVRKNNKLYHVFHNWGKEYSVEFDIIVTKNVDSILNVFHMTATNNNHGNHGDRIPALFLKSDKKFHFRRRVCSAW